MLTDKEKEILVITQEECAEVIQEISKVFRFGIENQHKAGPKHRQVLESEVGDLLCMIDLMLEYNIINKDNLNEAKNKKQQKLKVWSNIFK